MRFLLVFLMLCSLSACQKQDSSQVSTEKETAGTQNLPKILAFGNSLTAGLGLPASQSYPAILQILLDRDGYKYEIVNAGVSGDTTAGGLRRIDWSLEGDVRFVILELGGNDILRGLPVTELKSNLSRMIEKAQRRGARVLLAGMEAPTNAGPDYRKEVHEAYQDLARTADVTFVPFFLKDFAGSEKLIQEDGTHPNEEGNKVIAETVYQYLKPLL